MRPPRSPSGSRRRPGRDLAAIAILALLALASRAELLVDRIIPARGDTLTGFLPHKSFAARAIRDGVLPTWDPHIFSGQPFLADPQTAVFSPLSLPFWFLPLVPAFVVYILVKHLLAGAFTYGFLRALGANRGGSLLGAAAFMLSSTMFRQIPWQEVASTTVWVPLLFWLCELVIQRPGRLLPIALLPVFFFFENVAGHPQLTYYHYLALGLYCAARLVGRAIAARRLGPPLRAAAWLLVAVAVGAGLTAVQGAPLYEFKQATRYGEGFSLDEAANPQSSLSEIHRVFLGGVYPDHEDHVNTSYIGILPALLVPVGILAGGAFGWILAAIGALAVLMAVGLDTPLFPLLYRTLPGFRELHGPVRILPVATFAVSVLAGLGAARIADRFTGVARRGGPLLSVGASTLAILVAGAVSMRVTGLLDDLDFLYANLLLGLPAALFVLAMFFGGRIGRPLFLALALVVVAADLAHFSRTRYSFVYGDPDLYLEPPDTVRFVQEDPELARAAHFTNGFAVRKRTELAEELARQIVASIYPNTALHFGTHDPQGVYSLKVERYTDFVRAMNARVKGGRWILDRLTLVGDPFSRLFDLANVKYLLTSERHPLPESRPLRFRDDAIPLDGAGSCDGILLELLYPAGDGPIEPVTASVVHGDATVVTLRPTVEPPPEFARFLEYGAPPPPVELLPLIRVEEGAELKAAGFSNRGRRQSGEIRLDGEHRAQFLSPPVPFEYQVTVRIRMRPTERDDTGIYIGLVDAETGRALYGAAYGDERLSLLFRGKRGVQSTRARSNERGRTDVIELTLRTDRIFLDVRGPAAAGETGFEPLLDYRLLDGVRTGPIRVAVGAQGGEVAVESLEVLAPVPGDRWRTRRGVVDLDPGTEPRSLRLELPGGVLVSRVGLLRRGKFARVFESGPVAIFENREVMPRAFLVGGYRVLEDDDALLAALRDPELDPATTVLLREDPGLPHGPGPREVEGSVTVEAYGIDRIRCRVRASGDALLYFGDVMFPGWRARVDGNPRPVLTANHCFRAVALEAGEHEVELVYRPRSLRIGAAVSGGTLLLWAGIVILTARRRRRSPAPASPPAPGAPADAPGSTG